MKKLSKIFAVVLCLAMVLSMMAMTVSAAPTEKCVEFTVDSLGLESQKYTAGTATVGGVGVEWIQLGNYGNGIQMRDSEKDGEWRTSMFWNTSAMGSGITKIELTFNDAKSTYDNADAVIFNFGTAVKGDAYSTKLSTTADVKTYTITPDANTYTYFYLEHDLKYTFYWDSIKVYYNDNGSDDDGGATPPPVTPVEPSIDKISDALAGNDGDEFTVKGVVILIEGKNVYVQDKTGGICVRTKDQPADLTLGSEIKATGAKGAYNGLPQLNNSTYEVTGTKGLTIKETTIGALTTADLCTYVKLANVTVTEVFDNDGAYSCPNVTVSDGTNEIQVYKAIVDKDEDGAWTVKVGDKVDVYAAVSCFKDTLQLRNTIGAEFADPGSEPPVASNPGTGDMPIAALVVAMMAATGCAVMLSKKKEF